MYGIFIIDVLDVLFSRIYLEQLAGHFPIHYYVYIYKKDINVKNFLVFSFLALIQTLLKPLKLIDMK